MAKKIRIRPYLSKDARTRRTDSTGNKAKSIFEPSRGGIGTRLKIARTRFINTTVVERVTKVSGKPRADANLINKPKTTARIMFEIGPAIATINSPHF